MAEQLDGIVLWELRVRPIRDAVERASWDGLMEAHHYLGFRSPFEAALRHVAELPGGEWATLFGWPLGAFKVGARAGWTNQRPRAAGRRRHRRRIGFATCASSCGWCRNSASLAGCATNWRRC